MAHLNRAIHRTRIKARSRPQKNNGRSRNPQSSQPRDRLIQIDVTFTLRRRLVWLMTGITIGTLRLPDGLLEKASLILRALLPARWHN